MAALYILRAGAGAGAGTGAGEVVDGDLHLCLLSESINLAGTCDFCGTARTCTRS